MQSQPFGKPNVLIDSSSSSSSSQAGVDHSNPQTRLFKYASEVIDFHSCDWVLKI